MHEAILLYHLCLPWHKSIQNATHLGGADVFKTDRQKHFKAGELKVLPLFLLHSEKNTTAWLFIRACNMLILHGHFLSHY